MSELIEPVNGDGCDHIFLEVHDEGVRKLACKKCPMRFEPKTIIRKRPRWEKPTAR